MVVPEGIFLVKFLFGTLPATVGDFTLLDDAVLVVDKGERWLSTTFLVMVV